jgi:GAF domain-containing protein
VRRRSSGEREPAAESAASARELALAEQLAATGDILRIVSTMGPGSRVEPVLEAIVATAARLCGAEFALAYVRKEDGLYHTVAANRADAELVRYAVEHPLSPGQGSLIGRATLEGGPVHVEDCLADPDYAYPEFQRIGRFRTMLGVPLMRDGLAVGALGLLRSTVSPFSQAQIELVTTFADQAVIAIENVRLFQEVRARTDELGEALRQQTATADVLKVISRSTFNLEAVLDTLVESATRLCDADHSWLFLRDGNFFRWAASFGHGTEVHDRIEAYFKPLEVPVDRGSITGRAALEGRLVHVPDVLADPDYTWSEAQHIGGYRAAIGVPLFREGTVIGVIFVAKCLPEPFSANQMELVTTFADQAVIAIENVRLFDEVQARTRELEEALEYQTATGDVLNVISRSPAQIQPVLDTIVDTARRLCEAYDAVILLREGDYLSVASHRGPIPVDFAKWPISRGWVTGRAIVDGKPMHVADLEAAAEEFPDGHAMALRQGHRTLLATPLLREDVAIGAIVIRRTEVRPFSEKQIAVLQTFADQAVIAIENARLFEEVQARTAELTEALEQQTATSEVLQVISRSAFDLQTVLDTLVQSAARLGDADIGTITRQRDGSFFREALYGFSDEFIEYVRAIPVRPEKGNISGRALLEGKIVQIEDVERDPDYTWDEAKKTGRYRTLLGVPLVRHSKPIGVMALGRREVRPFNQREIDLVTTFADQAVIAIENVRLFDEVQARTRDLEELLQQQTATAEVLKVISRSTFELQPVLDTLVESAARLCEADMAAVARQTGTAFHYAATFGYSPELKAYLVGIPHTPGSGSIIGRTLEGGNTVHVADVLADPKYRMRDVQEKAGYRTVLCVPLLRERTPIGVVVLTRRAVRPFTDKQIELVTTFADQAVIAIENVRLFDEVQARTGELAKSVGELQALGEVSQAVNSTLDLQTVLKTIVAKAVQLSATDAGAIYVFSKLRQKFRLRATYGMSDAMIAEIGKQGGVRLGESYIGAATESGQAVQVPDLMTEAASPMRDLILSAGYRGLLVVPLLRPGGIVGALVVRRKDPGAFPGATIDLLQTFAAQSVVAIQNARLFEDVEARTRELAKSLEELRAAQERLIQTEKLASLGQLTAGIAHEIKNPLNFVNNFAALSIELIDELKDAIRSTPPDEEQAAELMALLAGNLGKVVQHGKRADSIVKNMLLHSRAESGERRVADINLLVEESLNLAYHGARAEKQGFNVTIERSLDPSAGEVDVLPQEITRVFLNLISNGFYATVKRKERASAAYEPILLAATRNLGDRVEIRIRDNGTGIPPEVKEKMFDPFFTTKPAGEGTGLGLSLSHDIVVKQHRGSIEVDTSPGEYTEFRIVLPRSAASPANDEVKR